MSRISKLIKLDRPLYHTRDLATIWGLTNPQSLYNAIQRDLKQGILIQLHKGLYSTLPFDRLDPIELGAAAYSGYTYLSLESVLIAAGVIVQSISTYTFIASKPKRLTIGDHHYHYRQLSEKFLHNKSGIYQKGGAFIATTERAVADLQYFNPHYHFDLTSQVDWLKVKQIKQQIGYI